VYIDLRRAFDLVSHQKLLHKLIAFGVDGLLLNWLKVFLSNRVQCVCVNGVLSSQCYVTCGVPHSFLTVCSAFFPHDCSLHVQAYIRT